MRRLASGERLNAAVDWPHVIEEVQYVGLSELRACQSLLEQALAHLLKLHALPESRVASHWRDEIRAFLHDAGRRFTPSMQQRIGLDELYANAAARARAAADDAGAAIRPIPPACPLTLEQLLGGRIPIPELIAALAPAAMRAPE